MGRESFGYGNLIKVVDNMPATLLICDRNRRVVYHNSVVCTALNIPEEKLYGATLDDLIENKYIINSASMEAFKTKQQSIRYVRGTGVSIPILTVSTPVLDENGKVEWVVAISLNEELLEVIAKEMVESRSKSLDLLDFFSSQIAQNNEIIAESEAMRAIIQFLSRLSTVDSNLLLTGETGTGKEVLAKYVHNTSSRKSDVFIPVNCAAIPESLMESEFFGYERGAFTGANKEGKAGVFELANGGSLFLDEVGEMSLLIQAKLLRVIETGEVSRLGSEHRKKVDFRLIAATNRNLVEMCEKGLFRTDLYYRLNILSVEIPPLRERKADILPLARFFLAKLNKKYGSSKILSYEARRRMENYSWPGNVRELHNVMERLVICSSSDILEFDQQYSNGFLSHQEQTEVPNVLGKLEFRGSLRETVDDYEKNLILNILEENEGNVAKTADMLKIHKSVLYRKLERYKKPDFMVMYT